MFTVVLKELLKRIENKELGDGALKNAQVIHWDKEFSSKFKTLNFLFLIYLFLPKNVFFLTVNGEVGYGRLTELILSGQSVKF